MKKTNKIASLDAILGQQKLSKNEMREINGGALCYCNHVYQGDMTLCQCCATCNIKCLGC